MQSVMYKVKEGRLNNRLVKSGEPESLRERQKYAGHRTVAGH